MNEWFMGVIWQNTRANIERIFETLFSWYFVMETLLRRLCPPQQALGLRTEREEFGCLAI